MTGGQNLPDLASGKGSLIALGLVSMPNLAPRRLSLEATRSFQTLYQEEFGELLSDDDAQHKGILLLNLFAILTRPDSNPAKSSAHVQHQGGRDNSVRKYS